MTLLGGVKLAAWSGMEGWMDWISPLLFLFCFRGCVREVSVYFRNDATPLVRWLEPWKPNLNCGGGGVCACGYIAIYIGGVISLMGW